MKRLRLAYPPIIGNRDAFFNVNPLEWKLVTRQIDLRQFYIMQIVLTLEGVR